MCSAWGKEMNSSVMSEELKQRRIGGFNLFGHRVTETAGQHHTMGACASISVH